MNKRNRFFHILILLLFVITTINFQFPKRVLAYSNNFTVNTIYQSDTVIKGYCYSYEDITATINGKVYKTTGGYSQFEIKVPKLTTGTNVIIKSGTESEAKVVQPLPAPTNISGYDYGDGKYELNCSLPVDSKDWKVKATYNGNTYEDNSENYYNSFYITIPKASKGSSIYLYTESSDGTRSRTLKYTIGDTVKPKDPNIDLVAYGKTSITGTAEAFTTIISAFGDNYTEYRTQADSSGKFTLNVDPIKDSYVKIHSVDGSGNVSNTIKVNTKDITPPSAPKVNTLYNTSDYVIGQAEKNSKVTVKIDSKTYTGTALSDGKFKVKIPKQPVNKTIEVYATDNSNNKGTTTKIKVSKDTTAPPIPKVKTVYSNSTLVQGTAEANANIEVKINNNTYKDAANSSGNYSVKIPSQNINTVIYVYAIDSGNNRSAAAKTVVRNYLEQYFYRYSIFDGTTYIVNKNVFDSSGYWKNSMIFEPYLKSTPNKGNLYFEAGFEQDDWVFFKQIKIVANGHTYTLNFDYFDVNRDVFIGGIKESIGFKPDSGLIYFLKNYAVNGSKVTVYFEGDNHYTGFVLSSAEKQAIDQTLKYAGY